MLKYDGGNEGGLLMKSWNRIKGIQVELDDLAMCGSHKLKGQLLLSFTKEEAS